MDLDKNEQVYFEFYGRRSLRIQMVFFAQNQGSLCFLQQFKLRIDDLVAKLYPSGFYVLYCLPVPLFNP